MLKGFKVEGTKVKLVYYGMAHSAEQIRKYVHDKFHQDVRTCPGDLSVKELSDAEITSYKMMGIKFEVSYFQ